MKRTVFPLDSRASQTPLGYTQGTAQCVVLQAVKQHRLPGSSDSSTDLKIQAPRGQSFSAQLVCAFPPELTARQTDSPSNRDATEENHYFLREIAQKAVPWAENSEDTADFAVFRHIYYLCEITGTPLVSLTGCQGHQETSITVVFSEGLTEG